MQQMEPSSPDKRFARPRFAKERHESKMTGGSEGSVCERWRGRVEAGTGLRGGHTQPDKWSRNAVREGAFRFGTPPQAWLWLLSSLAGPRTPVPVFGLGTHQAAAKRQQQPRREGHFERWRRPWRGSDSGQMWAALSLCFHHFIVPFSALQCTASASIPIDNSEETGVERHTLFFGEVGRE